MYQAIFSHHKFFFFEEKIIFYKNWESTESEIAKILHGKMNSKTENISLHVLGYLGW